MNKLTPKQERFCQEYIKDLNGKQAAIRAGYSKNCAESTASEILTYPNVKNRIAELTKPRTEEAGLTALRVLQEIQRISCCDIGQAFNEDGTLKALKDMPEDVRRAISAIEVDEITLGDEKKPIGYTRKIKFWDKNKAIEMAGRYHAMFTDVVKADVHIPPDFTAQELARIIAGENPVMVLEERRKNGH